MSDNTLITDLDITIVVPVKAFSSRCHHKNFKNFYDNKSLLDIKLSQLINVVPSEKILVFSDTDEAVSIADKYNVKVEFYTPTSNWSETFYNIAKKVKSKYLMRACVTAPFIGSKIIKDMIKTFLENQDKYDSIVAVERTQSHFVAETGEPINYEVGPKHVGSQDLEPFFSVKAGVFLLETKTALEYRYHFGGKPFLYDVPYLNALDINTDGDWDVAQLMLSSDAIKSYIGWELE